MIANCTTIYYIYKKSQFQELSNFHSFFLQISKINKFSFIFFAKYFHFSFLLKSWTYMKLLYFFILNDVNFNKLNTFFVSHDNDFDGKKTNVSFDLMSRIYMGDISRTSLRDRCTPSLRYVYTLSAIGVHPPILHIHFLWVDLAALEIGLASIYIGLVNEKKSAVSSRPLRTPYS